MDDVCITNTNRQLPALAATVGIPKVEVLARRVAGINPDCRVNRVIKFLTESNADHLLDGGFDYVVDAIDRTSIKALIIAKCMQRGLPVITSGSGGGGRDATALKLADLGFAGADPLLKGTRQILRRDLRLREEPLRAVRWPLGCRVCSPLSGRFILKPMALKLEPQDEA